jgi:uncharacterized protein YbjT (DUF2867 family)
LGAATPETERVAWLLHMRCEAGGCAMKVLVIGASGPTGRAVVDLALGRGLDAAVLVHRDFPVPEGAEGRAADLLDPASLSRAVAGCDAVISTLGPNRDSAPALCSRAYRNLVDAMSAEGAQRLVCVTGAMIGHPSSHLHGFYRIAPRLFPADVRAAIEDRRESERIVIASDLDWTIVRPPRLVDGTATAVEVGSDLRIGTFSWCPRRSLARLLVDEVHGPGHPRMAIAVRAVGAPLRYARPNRSSADYVRALGAQG